MINARHLPVLLICLALLASPAVAHNTGGTAGDETTNTLDALRVTNQTALPGSLGVHGTEVVFLGPLGDDPANATRVGLWLVDTTTGEERLLTQIDARPQQLTVDSLGYDGRYVAWSDDRSGPLQVYLVDTEASSFRALTDSDNDERQVAIDGGVVVWSSWGNFSVNALDLDDGIRYPVGSGAGVGPASAPDIWGDRVVWSKSVDRTNFEILYRNLTTGALDRVTYDPMIQTTPRISGNLVVWAESWLPEDFQSVADPNASDRPEGAQIALKDLSTNVTVELTPGFGQFQDPVISGDWASWRVASGGLAVYNLADRHLGILPAPSSATPDVVLSDDLLVFTLRGPGGLQVFADAPHHIVETQSQAASQGAGDGFGSTAFLAGGGLLLIVGGVGIEVWRRRGSG